MTDKRKAKRTELNEGLILWEGTANGQYAAHLTFSTDDVFIEGIITPENGIHGVQLVNEKGEILARNYGY